MSFLKYITKILILSFSIFLGHTLINHFLFTNIGSQHAYSDVDSETNLDNNLEAIIDLDYFNNNPKLGKKDTLAVLLLGVDENSFEGSRTDSIILAIINKNEKKVNLLSIPRDLRVKLYNSNRHEKINSAFAFGGVDLAAATIEEHFGIPINHYSVINFNGFEDLVDSLGGLEIHVEKDLRFPDRITRTNFSLSEGQQTLNGYQVLNYARFRGDSEGDYGRMRRQQQVIEELMNQTVSFRSIPKLTDIYKAIDSNLQTNINFADITLLALKLRTLSGDDLQTMKFDTYPANHGGVSYVESSQDELERVKEELRHLIK